MDRDKLKEVVSIVIALIVSIVVIKILIWLLPIILILWLAYFIYRKMKNINIDSNKDVVWERKNDSRVNKKKLKTKKVIIDEEK